MGCIYLITNIINGKRYVGQTRFEPEIRFKRHFWNRSKPFFDSIISDETENIIIVSHGDLLSVFNTMFLDLEPDFINNCEIFGLAGGVSQMYINDDKKRYIKRISDLSYMQKNSDLRK